MEPTLSGTPIKVKILNDQYNITFLKKTNFTQ